MLDIPMPQINIDSFTNWDEIYQKHTYKNKVWIFETTYLDKVGLQEDIENKLGSRHQQLLMNFIKDYKDTLKNVTNYIKNHFIKNLDTYSLKLKEMNGSKEEMKQLGEEIQKIVNELEKCTEELNEIIWGGVQNV